MNITHRREGLLLAALTMFGVVSLGVFYFFAFRLLSATRSILHLEQIGGGGGDHTNFRCRACSQSCSANRKVARSTMRPSTDAAPRPAA